LVVVVLGDTIGGYGNPVFLKAWVGQQVTSLTRAISATGTPCVWVGPAWGGEGGKYKRTYSRVRELSAFLSNAVTPCTYIDSLTFSKQGEWATIDGQHMTVPGYQRWGAAIADRIAALPAFQGKK
jgi:hypothetical protein